MNQKMQDIHASTMLDAVEQWNVKLPKGSGMKEFLASHRLSMSQYVRQMWQDRQTFQARIAQLEAENAEQAAEMAQRDDTEAMGEARYQDGYQDGMAAGRAAVLQEQPALESALSLLGTQRAIVEGEIRKLHRQSQQMRQEQAEAVQQGYADGVELGKKNAVSEMIALSYRDPETLRRIYDEEEAKIRGYVAAQVRREFALRP